jgi:hypothetical protein
MACPMCGHDASTTLPLPVEPLYDGETAAMLVPMSLDGFRRLLQRHRDQLPAPYYRYWRGRRYRFHTAHEIKFAREIVFHRHREILSRGMRGTRDPSFLGLQPDQKPARASTDWSA